MNKVSSGSLIPERVLVGLTTVTNKTFNGNRESTKHLLLSCCQLLAVGGKLSPRKAWLTFGVTRRALNTLATELTFPVANSLFKEHSLE